MNTQPDLILSAHHLNLIEEWIEKLDLDEQRVEELETELARAQIVKHFDLPKDRVGMGSRVTFQLGNKAETFTKTLCFPHELKDFEDGISIFAPIGSALLGLAIGQTIHWPGARGEQVVKIIDVEQELVESGAE
ncbi:transcription elongation factor GreAB [Aliidiomarina taiwanensis]|uniref:Transcription elongation factor GreAB n=1 Tax=Aliidiomarina taiwanensis TaxID=946228 RepID=A0A432XA55_9GAMM|nr:GreA/GreB family elongation factor [Aliidiomarina taiwanensis]RUO44267.1 transcription elongation factor GreAB [Aliidiomarina taiwanensis]